MDLDFNLDIEAIDSAMVSSYNESVDDDDDLMDMNINERHGEYDDDDDDDFSESSNEFNLKIDTIAPAKVGIAQKKEISADVYNSALTALQKSYKEGFELVSMLRNATIVDD